MTRLFVADTWAMLVVAWAFTIVRRRGTWRPAAETTAAWLALARKRARRTLWAARVQVLLLAAQVAVVVGARAWREAHGVGTTGGGPVWLAALAVAAVVVASLAWAYASRRRALRELRYLTDLAAENPE
jgi:hypothetical protein